MIYLNIAFLCSGLSFSQYLGVSFSCCNSRLYAFGSPCMVVVFLGYPVIPVLHVCMESLDHHNGACAV